MGGVSEEEAPLEDGMGSHEGEMLTLLSAYSRATPNADLGGIGLCVANRS